MNRRRILERERSVYCKFRVNSLSIVYHCAIHNLPTFYTLLLFVYPLLSICTVHPFNLSFIRPPTGLGYSMPVHD